MTFRLTKTILQAADDVAQGKLSAKEIAEKCNVNERTINRWKSRREFRAIVNKQVTDFGKALRRQRIKEVQEECRQRQEKSESVSKWQF